MARKKGPARMTSKEFVADAESALKAVEDMDAPLMITAKGRPAAYLMNAAEYELCQKKLTAYERMTKMLDEADRLRMEAQAKAIAEVTRRGRKV